MMRIFLLSALIIFSPLATPIEELPEMGAPSDSVLTPIEEKRLGDAFFRNLHRHIDINQDLEIEDYIASLGNSLASHSDAPAHSFHFFVVLSPEINAFAGPAGYIGVNAGLILNTRTESELASVISHEIAHVTQNHLHRAFAAAKRMTLPMAAATLAAILIGTQVPELGQAALIALQAGGVQYQINFTRDNEKEADRIGLQILAKSNFNPRSMPAFFERLQQSTQFLGRDLPEFLRTHPVTSSRIADTRARADKFPYRQYPDSLHYLLTKAKLRVMTARNLENTVVYFRSRLNRGTPKQQAAVKYGLALALLEQHQLKESHRLLSQLLTAFPDQPQFINAIAQAEIELGQIAAGLKRYQTALRRFPASRILRLEYAQALLEARHFESARRLLTPYANNPRFPLLYKLLSRAYAGLGQHGEAHRYMAEYYYATGNLENAIQQAKLATKTAAGDRIVAAIAEERLRYFKAEKKARKK